MADATPGGRVLLVEGERLLGRRIKERLESLGYRCYWAQELDEAHQVAELLAPPDAVVLHALIATAHPWPTLVESLRVAAGRETWVVVYGVSPTERTAALSDARRPEGVVGRVEDEGALLDGIVAALSGPTGSDDASGAAPGELHLGTHELEVPTVDLEPIEEEAAERSPFDLEGEGSATERGDLATLPMPHLLWHLHSDRASGELRVDLTEGPMQIFLEDGRPIVVMGGGPANVLGRVMERAGLLSPEAHRRALAELASRPSGERFGEVLMRHGAITAVQLERGLGLQMEAKIHQLFTVPSAPWAFYEGRESDASRHPLSVPKIILKGLALLPREDVLERLQPYMSQFPIADVDGLPDEFPVNARTTALLALLGGTSQLSQLLEGIGDPALPPMLLGLEAMGCLRFRMTPSIPASDPVDDDEEPEPTSKALEDMSGKYLRIKGKNFYDALGLPRNALPAEVLEACEQALEGLGNPEELEEGVARDRARELRRLFETIRTTLTEPANREAYDQSLAQPRTDLDYSQGFRTEELLQRAQHHVAAEEWDQAQDLFAQAQEAAPSEDADILGGLGYSLYRKAAESRMPVPIQALLLVKRALEIRPRFALAALYAGEILQYQNVLDEAARFYRYGLRHDPDNPQLQRALKLLGPEGPSLPRPHVLFASDIVCDGATMDLETKLRTLHQRAFAQALEKLVAPVLLELGSTFEDDSCPFETRGKPLCGVAIDPGRLTPTARGQLLAFPSAFKQALDRHLVKAMKESESALMPKVRVSVVVGDAATETDGHKTHLVGGLVTRALTSLPKDTSTFASDVASLRLLLAASSRELPRLLDSLGLAAFTTADGEAANPIVVVGPRQGGPRGEVHPAIRSDRPLAARVIAEELEVLQKLEAAVVGLDERLRAIFHSIQRTPAPAEPTAGILERVGVRKSVVAKPEVARLRTRLFHPMLQGNRVFLSYADLRQWLKLVEAVGRSYTDALFKEGEAHRKANKAFAQGNLEPGVVDLMRPTPEVLLAASEACRLLGSAFQTRKSYDDCTFSELTSIAADRVRRVLVQSGDQGKIATAVAEIYDAAIDASDDSLEAVTFFEFFAVVSFLGVIDGTRSYEIDHLSETHRPGSKGYDKALADINDTADRFLTMLRGGLRGYARIARIFRVRSPFASREVRGMFATSYDLPLFHHVEALS